MTAGIPKPSARAALTSQTQVLRQNLQTPIPAPRISLERKISIRFPHFQGFLTEYSSNVSITGMFIRARFPQRPGTILDFEFNLNDGLKLIRGTGEVIWVRRKDEEDLPAGMGIRFLRLDAESRRLIRWAVEKQIDEGAKTFDLEAGREEVGAEVEVEESRPEAGDVVAPMPAPSPAARGDVDKVHPYAGYAVARHARRGWLPAAGAGVLLLVVLGAMSLWPSVSEPKAGEPTAGAQAPSVVPELPRTAPEAPAAPEIAPPSPDKAQQEMVRATEAWAEAWAEQRPDEYLSFYSRSFQSPGSESRGEWEARRRDRIRKPDFIQVGISGLEAELLSSERGRVRFDQAYRSDSYRDSTRKTLELVLEDGRWKILEERSGT